MHVKLICISDLCAISSKSVVTSCFIREYLVSILPKFKVQISVSN